MRWRKRFTGPSERTFDRCAIATPNGDDDVLSRRALGTIKQQGVMAPEMCIEPVDFFDRLSDKGVKIMREGRL